MITRNLRQWVSILSLVGITQLLTTLPGMAQAFQPQALPADRTMSQANEASLSYLRMSPDLLAAAEAAPSVSRPWQFAQRYVAQAGASTTKTPAEGADASSEHVDLAEIGAKLSNPVSDIWALNTQFGLTFNDGDVNTGDPEVGFNMVFQPLLPLPLFSEWLLIVRPTIPILFGQPVPKGFDDFDEKTGFGDTFLPLLLSPPAGNWLLGLGPTFTLPTSTVDAFGRQQWAVGPTAIIGYITEKTVMAVFPQYFFGIGSRGDQDDTPDASYMSLLYIFFYNLPDAWQVGFNPTITYDDKALSDNKWNVPIGLTVTKTTRFGKQPVKFQFGFEYSVVNQDAFGQRFQVKLNVIPVIPRLIKKPLFGGASR